MLDRSENQLDTAIILPTTLPSELRPLAESFDRLLSRVAAIRTREKDFIRHASHELRTPIASLAATTELALSKERDAQEYKRHLHSCAKTSADLAALVQRLSALSRIGTAEASTKLVPVDLSEILSNSLRGVSERASAIGIEIVILGTPSPALADPVLVALVINNLLDNAVSYSLPDTTIKIVFEKTVERVTLSFTNPCEDLPDDLERLFEPLFRRDTSRTETQNSHLGIGLTLSREAAQSMHGTLTASRSNPGSISLTLSLRLSAESPEN